VNPVPPLGKGGLGGVKPSSPPYQARLFHIFRFRQIEICRYTDETRRRGFGNQILVINKSRSTLITAEIRSP
ncbi:MAG TPA: hypothetical protein DCQ51_06230, partial [Planktothrix sp. UBA8407]|nr:hypothetical protein [Planktothrix sp. UBA8407]